MQTEHQYNSGIQIPSTQPKDLIYPWADMCLACMCMHVCVSKLALYPPFSTPPHCAPCVRSGPWMSAHPGWLGVLDSNWQFPRLEHRVLCCGLHTARNYAYPQWYLQQWDTEHRWVKLNQLTYSKAGTLSTHMRIFFFYFVLTWQAGRLFVAGLIWVSRCHC